MLRTNECRWCATKTVLFCLLLLFIIISLFFSVVVQCVFANGWLSIVLGGLETDARAHAAVSPSARRSIDGRNLRATSGKSSQPGGALLVLFRTRLFILICLLLLDTMGGVCVCVRRSDTSEQVAVSLFFSCFYHSK